MATKAATAPGKRDFIAAFEALRAILARHAASLRLVHNSDTNYYLETKTPAYRGKPICFGAVRLGKNYVSYHLMAVYSAQACVTPKKGSSEEKIVGAASKLARGMSAELRKHMQGKSCFNFKRPEPELFAELAAITDAGFEGYKRLGWI
jgi:hypothetical protein